MIQSNHMIKYRLPTSQYQKWPLIWCGIHHYTSSLPYIHLHNGELFQFYTSSQLVYLDDIIYLKEAQGRIIEHHLQVQLKNHLVTCSLLSPLWLHAKLRLMVDSSCYQFSIVHIHIHTLYSVFSQKAILNHRTQHLGIHQFLIFLFCKHIVFQPNTCWIHLLHLASTPTNTNTSIPCQLLQ